MSKTAVLSLFQNDTDQKKLRGYTHKPSSQIEMMLLSSFIEVVHCTWRAPEEYKNSEKTF